MFLRTCWDVMTSDTQDRVAVWESKCFPSRNHLSAIFHHVKPRSHSTTSWIQEPPVRQHLAAWGLWPAVLLSEGNYDVYGYLPLYLSSGGVGGMQPTYLTGATASGTLTNVSLSSTKMRFFPLSLDHLSAQRVTVGLRGEEKQADSYISWDWSRCEMCFPIPC